ncbi:helix-turn-helix domain-containing protein [Carnobacterium viridans]|uniref:helix-turn-helix domain-containing protein n=1 Tax=Carnobacterium viridans TaxID=174587 RepID=UPI001CFFC7FF|nr:Rgg/GadR/MutR family transcriptional regulator [Carnobacterium viridans]UDE94485.1 helix-turn-helix domain-containing protein [Carnobacterium viridans]
MKTGIVVRYIRLSKKLKSKNVYTNILSRPAVSRFENGLSDTTTEKLFQILTNLNISLDEFYFIYNDYKVENDSDFFNNYSQAFYLNNLARLNELKVITEQKYRLTNQVKQLHYSVLCDLTASYISNLPINMENLKVLNTYLLECEEWTYYELVLFTNSLDFFPEELILLLYKRTKKKLEDFSQLKKYNNEVFSLLSNILVVFITKNDTEKCIYFYNELKKSVSETNNKMYEKTMLTFFKELIGIMKSRKLNSQNIEKIISLFTYLDMPLKKGSVNNFV